MPNAEKESSGISEKDSNIIASILIYCRQQGYHDTATLINEHANISNFTKYTPLKDAIGMEQPEIGEEKTLPEVKLKPKIKKMTKPRKHVEKPKDVDKSVEGLLKSKDHTIKYLRKKLTEYSAKKIYPEIIPRSTFKEKPVCIVNPYRYNPFKKRNILPRLTDQ